MHYDLPPMIGVTKRNPTKVHLPTYPPTHLYIIWQSVSLSTTLRRRIVCHATRRWTEPLIYIRKCIWNDAFGFGSAPLVVSWCRLFSSAIYLFEEGCKFWRAWVELTKLDVVKFHNYKQCAISDPLVCKRPKFVQSYTQFKRRILGATFANLS